jgi:hypothetical protein
MTWEHLVLAAMVTFVAATTIFGGYLAYRAHKSAQQIEGLTAATYLEARRALERLR